MKIHIYNGGWYFSRPSLIQTHFFFPDRKETKSKSSSFSKIKVSSRAYLGGLQENLITNMSNAAEDDSESHAYNKTIAD